MLITKYRGLVVLSIAYSPSSHAATNFMRRNTGPVCSHGRCVQGYQLTSPPNALNSVCSVGRCRRHGDRPARRVRLPGRQDLDTRFRHQQRVLCGDVSGLLMVGVLDRIPNWAVFFPSIVVLVQLSGHVTSLYLPSAIMGSMVKVMPGLHSPTALFLA